MIIQHKKKPILIILILALPLILPLINADILIINSGGSRNICINPSSLFGCFGSGDKNPPSISLISPENNDEDTDGIVDFFYNVSSVWDINNCSIFLDNVKTKTELSITKDIIQSIRVNSPPVKDSLSWYISCTDQFNNVGNSETRQIDTNLGSGHPTGSGGGVSIKINKTVLCSLTFNQTINSTRLIQEQYKNITEQSISFLLVKSYIEGWESFCQRTTFTIVSVPEELEIGTIWLIILVIFLGVLGIVIYTKRKKLVIIIRRFMPIVDNSSSNK